MSSIKNHVQLIGNVGQEPTITMSSLFRLLINIYFVIRRKSNHL